jgi:hypothetical protein
VADVMMWSALFSMVSPPHLVVVDQDNHVQGHADDPGIQEGPTTLEDPRADEAWSAGDEAAQGSPAVEAESSPGDGGDGGGSESSSGFDGGDGGGGFDGGGFDGGGFDGGGFD